MTDPESETGKSSRRWLCYLLPTCILLVALGLVASDLGGWFSAPAYIRDGQEAMASEDFAEAIRHFSAAQRRSETDIAARYLLGAAYHNYAWHDEALEEYNVTWNLAAENATRAMHSAGRIWYGRGEHERAALCFQRAVTLTPASPDIWFELGDLHREAGQIPEAIGALREAVRHDPQNAIYAEALRQILHAANESQASPRTESRP